MNAEVNTMLNTMADAARPIVAAIEGTKVPTTQGRYDEYMSAIERFARMLPGTPSTNTYLAVGAAFMRAGANRPGVIAALQALGHLDHF